MSYLKIALVAAGTSAVVGTLVAVGMVVALKPLKDLPPSNDLPSLRGLNPVWLFGTERDKFTDKVTTYVFADNEEKSARFYIRCNRVTPLLDRPNYPVFVFALVTEEFLGESGSEIGRRIEYRLGNFLPTEQYWIYGDNIAQQKPADTGVEMQLRMGIVEGIIRGDPLLIRATTYRYRHVDAEFRGVGGKNAIEQLVNDCETRISQEKR